MQARREPVDLAPRAKPARRARRIVSPAVVTPTDKLAAIMGFDMPPARSLSTSRILRMGNLSQSCPAPFKGVEAMPIRRSPNSAGHTPPQPGRDRPERVAATHRNSSSQSIGISGRNQPVRAVVPALYPGTTTND